MRSDIPTDMDLLDRLRLDAELLLDAYGRCDPTSGVPGLEWNARDVVVHTGAVHRWSADLIARRLPTNETGGSAAFRPQDITEEALASWFAAGVAALIDTLHGAPRDLTCYTFLPRIPARRFWIARQAHETAIHRADVEAAAGRTVTPVAAPFAQDGLAELVGGFATAPQFAVGRPGRLMLAASDGPSWRIEFGGPKNVIERDVPPDADAVVSGTSSELYYWAWNRPSTADEHGDVQVLSNWRAVRIG